jgi:hypothetical protein
MKSITIVQHAEIFKSLCSTVFSFTEDYNGREEVSNIPIITNDNNLPIVEYLLKTMFHEGYNLPISSLNLLVGLAYSKTEFEYPDYLRLILTDDSIQEEDLEYVLGFFVKSGSLDSVRLVMEDRRLTKIEDSTVCSCEAKLGNG